MNNLIEKNVSVSIILSLLVYKNLLFQKMYKLNVLIVLLVDNDKYILNTNEIYI